MFSKFEEEQAMLRRRVEANEIKIAELRASNEYLMAQNAQLRLNTVQVSRVVSTVTNTTPQQAAVQAQPTVRFENQTYEVQYTNLYC